MALKDTIKTFTRKLRLDSHHAMERFGAICGVLAVTFVAVMAGSAFSAWNAGRASLADTALYTESFTTSKTQLRGEVTGVYRNELGNKAMVVMAFDPGAQISYNASDYEAFLIGSDEQLNTHTIKTEGIDSSFYVFGSTGYMGLVLEAAEPFEPQVMNLTMRANNELTYQEPVEGEAVDELGDNSFAEYDQWRVFFNAVATGAERIPALEAARFDPAKAFYDVVIRDQEAEVRQALDDKLIEMRAALSRIDTYTKDLQTTKVDGLFLRQPQVPTAIDGDLIAGQSANESDDGVSTLALKTDYVMPGGFDFAWRSGACSTPSARS